MQPPTSPGSSPKYAICADLRANHAEAIDAVTAELKTHGFGILTTIDVQATFKAKLGIEVEPQTILGACNPKLAARGLEGEQALGVLLPCNVFVRQLEPGLNRIFFTHAAALFGLVDNPAVEPLAADVDRVMRAVAHSLTH